VCAACNHHKTFEAMVDAYCQADFGKLRERKMAEKNIMIS
jgi:hypothetical protein